MAKGLFVDGEKVRAIWAETLKSQEGFAALWGYKRNNLVRIMRPGLQGVGRDQLGRFVEAMGWDLQTARGRLGIVEREEPDVNVQRVPPLTPKDWARLRKMEELKGMTDDQIKAYAARRMLEDERELRGRAGALPPNPPPAAARPPKPKKPTAPPSASKNVN